MNIQGWFPLGLISLISLLSNRLSRVFSSTTVQKHQFFGTQPFSWSSSHIRTWLLDALIIWTFFSKVIFLLFNTLSRFVIAILPRNIVIFKSEAVEKLGVRLCICDWSFNSQYLLKAFFMRFHFLPEYGEFCSWAPILALVALVSP